MLNKTDNNNKIRKRGKNIYSFGNERYSFSRLEKEYRISVINKRPIMRYFGTMEPLYIELIDMNGSIEYRKYINSFILSLKILYCFF